MRQTAFQKAIHPDKTHEISSLPESRDLLFWPLQFYFTEVNVFITGKDSTRALESTKRRRCWSACPQLTAAQGSFPLLKDGKITSSKLACVWVLTLQLSFVNDCRLCSLTLLDLMESDISRIRPQRVCALTINLTPPMSPLLMFQLLHYLEAFLYLCSCQDQWEKCPAVLTGLEINDFIKEKLQKMYSGKINSPECTLEVRTECRAQWQVWHTT